MGEPGGEMAPETSPGKIKCAMLLRIVRYALLGIAWALFILSLWLPQAMFLYRANEFMQGKKIALLAFIYVIWNLITLRFTQEAIFGLALVLSEVLFAVSPFALLPYHLRSRWRFRYGALNFICTLMFGFTVGHVLHDGLSALSSLTLEFSPNILVWFAAQVILTLAAGLAVLEERKFR